MVAVGLGILPQIYSQIEPNTKNYNYNYDYNCSSNSTTIVVKSGLRSVSTTTPMIASTPSSSLCITTADSNGDHSYNYTFQRLKSCPLCAKHLRPDQDIFMYRGDMGFCSEECRNWQIMVDERRESEERLANMKKKKQKSFDCRGCETCRVLEDLRRHRRRPNNYQPILSLS